MTVTVPARITAIVEQLAKNIAAIDEQNRNKNIVSAREWNSKWIRLFSAELHDRSRVPSEEDHKLMQDFAQRFSLEHPIIVQSDDGTLEYIPIPGYNTNGSLALSPELAKEFDAALHFEARSPNDPRATSHTVSVVEAIMGEIAERFDISTDEGRNRAMRILSSRVMARDNTLKMEAAKARKLLKDSGQPAEPKGSDADDDDDTYLDE